jgi:hypothetical protein
MGPVCLSKGVVTFVVACVCTQHQCGSLHLHVTVLCCLNRIFDEMTPTDITSSR